ncbi:MAG: hypothetical protein ACP5KW_00355 [Thermoproteota archaeon]|jgi:hypothetical protein
MQACFIATHNKKLLRLLVGLAFMVFVVFISDFFKVALAEPQFFLRRVYNQNFDSSLGEFRTYPPNSSSITLVSSSSPQGGKAVLINGSSLVSTYIYYVNSSYKSTVSLSFFMNIVSQLDPQRNFVFLNFSYCGTNLTLFVNSSGYLSANRSKLTNSINSNFKIAKETWYYVNITYFINDSSLVLIMRNSSLTYKIFKMPFSISNYGPPVLVFSIGVLDPIKNSRGLLLVDSFNFSVSPILNIDPPIALPGETLRIRGDYFNGLDTVNISISLNRKETLLIYPIQTFSNGSFLFSVKLPSEIENGLYKVVASQKSMGGAVMFHLGVIKLQLILNKTVPFSFYGYNFKPNSSVSLSLFSVAPRSKVLTFGSFISNNSGTIFFNNVVIPAYLKSGDYFLSISSDGTFDYNYYNFTKDFQVSVYSAPLNVSIRMEKNEYLRTQLVVIYVFAKYINGTSVSPFSRVYVEVMGPQIPVVVKTQMNYLSSIDGWVYSFKLPYGSPLGKNNVIVTVDDLYGNIGIGKTFFLVKPGLIQVSSSNLSSFYDRPNLVKVFFMLSYPDGSPVSNGTYSMLISNSVFTKKYLLHYYPNYTYWFGEFKLDPSGPIGKWNLSLVGQDLQGNFLSETFSFIVRPSKLNLILSPINSSYYRTEEVLISALVKYPSTGELLTRGTGIVSLRNANSSYTYALTYNSSFWVCSFKVPINIKVGSYNLTIFITDDYSNNGSITKSIEIKNAPLRIEVNLSKRSIQVGFDTVKITAKVQYPDGSVFSDKDGNLSIVVVMGTATKKLQAYYTGKAWVSYLQTSLFDPAGEYLIDIKAEDKFGNYGSYAVSIDASQLLVALSLGLIVVAFAVVVAIFWRYTSSRKRPSSKKESSFELLY